MAIRSSKLSGRFCWAQTGPVARISTARRNQVLSRCLIAPLYSAPSSSKGLSPVGTGGLTGISTRREWPQCIAQQVRLRVISHQMRVAFTAMILNIISEHEAAVIGSDDDRLGSVLGFGNGLVKS